MSADDVGGGVGEARRLGAARAEGKITHLPFHAARHDAAATRVHADGAQLGQDVLPCHLVPPHGPRGEWPPHAAACGG